MLKIAAILLDIVSAIFSILAPIAVVHWVVGVFDIEGIAGIVGFFEAIFGPFNYAIEALSPMEMPKIDYNEKQIAITQGVLAFFLTMFFFLFAFLAHLTRVADKRITLAKDIERTQRQARALAAEEEAKTKQVVSASRVLIYLIFPFEQERNAANFFSNYKEFSGRQVQTQTEGWLIAFDNITHAMQYATKTAEKLVEYYASLRPMDPQPPFHMGMHTVVPTNEAMAPGMEKCQSIIRYSGDNQIIFSQQLLELLREQQQTSDYSYQSLGFYDFSNEHNQEIFRLFYKMPEQKIYY